MIQRLIIHKLLNDAESRDLGNPTLMIADPAVVSYQKVSIFHFLLLTQSFTESIDTMRMIKGQSLPNAKTLSDPVILIVRAWKLCRSNLLYQDNPLPPKKGKKTFDSLKLRRLRKFITYELGK